MVAHSSATPSSRGAARVAASPAAAPAFSTKLSARGAFLLNAAFVLALVVLSQLPLLDDRPVVRASILAPRARCSRGAGCCSACCGAGRR